MTHGSLFAGIGGFDLGFERAGMTTVWQVEIDEYCRKVLAKHFPQAERYGDIRECGKHNLKYVDVISGGFPCQDISHAGKRVGIDGERSGLWREMWRVICELRPRFVVVENVAALLHRGIERVLGDLAACGYDAEWDCIPAQAVGAPHRRDRVWIVAYRQADAPRTDSNCNGPHRASSDYDRAFECLQSRHQQSGNARQMGKTVAYANRERQFELREARLHVPGTRRNDTGRCGADVADTNGKRQRQPEIEAYAGGTRGPARLVADVRSLRCTERGTGADVADAERPERRALSERRDGARSAEGSNAGGDGLPQSEREWELSQPIAQCDWWAVEPDVGRVADGVPASLDGNRRLWPTPRADSNGSRPNGKGGKILNEEVLIAEGLRNRGEKIHDAKTGTKNSQPEQSALSGLRFDTEYPEASPRVFDRNFRDFLSELSCQGRSEQRLQANQEDEAVQDMRKRIPSQTQSETYDLQQRMLGGSGAIECDETMAPNPWKYEPDIPRVATDVKHRVDRLKGLGNSLVPQIAEWIGRRLMEVNA